MLNLFLSFYLLLTKKKKKKKDIIESPFISYDLFRAGSHAVVESG